MRVETSLGFKAEVSYRTMVFSLRKFSSPHDFFSIGRLNSDLCSKLPQRRKGTPVLQQKGLRQQQSR